MKKNSERKAGAAVRVQRPGSADSLRDAVLTMMRIERDAASNIAILADDYHRGMACGIKGFITLLTEIAELRTGEFEHWRKFHPPNEEVRNAASGAPDCNRDAH